MTPVSHEEQQLWCGCQSLKEGVCEREKKGMKVKKSVTEKGEREREKGVRQRQRRVKPREKAIRLQ